MTLFQSTPANFTAGDSRSTSSAAGSTRCQSTPAYFTAGDYKPAVVVDNAATFQSTPANFTAGDQQAAPLLFEPGLVSIHARQFHSGRRSTAGPVQVVEAVSIHARQFHSGRRMDAPRFKAHHTPFQSTPANFTAGDPTHRPGCASGRRFNPRPPISQRATYRITLSATSAGNVSIHARQFHSGRPAGTCTSWPA